MNAVSLATRQIANLCLLIGAKEIVKKGGDIIVACECREGLGSAEFSEIIRTTRDAKEFREKYSDPGDFVIDQWCAQSIYQALDHAGQVYVNSSGLDTDDLKHAGIMKIDDIQVKMDDFLSKNLQVAVIPDGPYVKGVVT